MVDKGSRDVVHVALSREEFSELVRSEVRAAVREVVAACAPPDALSTPQLARTLGVSTDTINRWRAAGMPCEFVGKSPRFNLAACRAWLAERARERRSA